MLSLYFIQPLEELLGVSDDPLTSCQEHYDQGERTNGIYTIKVRSVLVKLSWIPFFKPSEKIRPFNVTCEFDSGYGRAIISPKYENDFQYTSIPGGSDGCKDPGCYTDNIRFKLQFINNKL